MKSDNSKTEALLNDPISRHMTPLPLVVEPSHSYFSVEKLMQRYDLRHLPVLEGEKLLGIISERDIQAAKVFIAEKFNTEAIRAVVEQNFLTSHSEALTLDVIKTMNKKKVDCVLVLKDSKVIGIFTLSDAMRLFLSSPS